ncbi:GNAT family N-acetyltransferase [Nocardioides acrostichi]|uniref:GNAT family N-acetyltransferase n=1 Tax=Nocardioides acrostichi TaxID=2784339 RepID=A0A930Y5R6_9ACTN|nr:GNAT family N-acetyltransferase [Nocardioides acrostichi]MBF4160162.1 GNAT family N-acetyltransferase [Nocardioides acrostichi]
MSMLWRVRASLPDRPGGLAALAQRCAEAGVDIRGLQIFPDTDAVTDELVLETPSAWAEPDLDALVAGAGWTFLTARECTAAALTDQPTRYVEAARSILARPASFPEVVAALFDAEPGEGDASGHDLIEMTVGDVGVQVRRAAPFTDIERSRGAAMARLVDDVMRRSRESVALGGGHGSGGRMGQGAEPDFVIAGLTVAAMVDDVLVGQAAVLAPEDDDPEVRPVSLQVDPGWRRRGIGTRLLSDIVRLAHAEGVQEIVLSASSDNQAVMPMVLGAGLRGRIRVAGGQLTVRIALRQMSWR